MRWNKASSITSRKKICIYLLFLRGALAERQKHFEPAEKTTSARLSTSTRPTAWCSTISATCSPTKACKLPEALKMVRKAVEQEPMNGAYLDSLGWVYFKMGQYELAEENLRQAVERDADRPHRPRAPRRPLRKDRSHSPRRGAMGVVAERVFPICGSGCRARRCGQAATQT